LATPAQGATGFTRDGVKLPLEYMGQAYHLRNQAVPLQFRITGNTGLMLALGQTIQVFVQTATQAQGFLLPRASVAQGADDKAQVWVHHAAEVFSPRTVRVQAVDEATVLVVEGLAAGDHVVTAGAQLLSQVR
jgi:multidrug efflux pump subunit AcrA (membrane-fusion protein)